eukprot:jgi/Ulvmu1/3701/UM170_0007.1
MTFAATAAELLAADTDISMAQAAAMASHSGTGMAPRASADRGSPTSPPRGTDSSGGVATAATAAKLTQEWLPAGDIATTAATTAAGSQKRVAEEAEEEDPGDNAAGSALSGHAGKQFEALALPIASMSAVAPTSSAVGAAAFDIAAPAKGKRSREEGAGEEEATRCTRGRTTEAAADVIITQLDQYISSPHSQGDTAGWDGALATAGDMDVPLPEALSLSAWPEFGEGVGRCFWDDSCEGPGDALADVEALVQQTRILNERHYRP